MYTYDTHIQIHTYMYNIYNFFKINIGEIYYKTKLGWIRKVELFYLKF